MRCSLVVILVLAAAASLAFHLGHEDVAQAALFLLLLVSLPLAVALGDALGARAHGEADRLLAKGDEVGALAALDAAAQRRPHDVALRVRRGALRLKRGDRAGALDDANAALARSPLRGDALDLLVDATRTDPEPARRQRALMNLERRLSLTLDALGDSPRLLRARARTRVELADGWAAREDVDRATALGDRDPRTRQARACALALTDELDAALRLADDLVAEADPDAPSAVPLRAWLRLVAGDVAGALHDLNDLARYAPDLGYVRRYRGIALAIEGDRDGAVADLTRAAELDPDDAVARLWLTLLGAPAPDGSAPPARWDVAITRALTDGTDPLAAADLAVSEADRRACLRHAHAARALAAERAGDDAAARAAWEEVAALPGALDPLPAWARRRLSAPAAPASS